MVFFVVEVDEKNALVKIRIRRLLANELLFVVVVVVVIVVEFIYDSMYFGTSFINLHKYT